MYYRSPSSSDSFGTVIGYIVLIAVIFVGAWSCESAQCSSRWNGSGLDSSWGPIQGCLVQTPDGRWIPSDNVRGIDLKGDE